MTNLSSQALDHLDASLAAHDMLQEAYGATVRNPQEIARLHQSVDRGLKVARVYAELALAEAIIDAGRRKLTREDLADLSASFRSARAGRLRRPVVQGVDDGDEGLSDGALVANECGDLALDVEAPVDGECVRERVAVVGHRLAPPAVGFEFVGHDLTVVVKAVLA